MILILCTIGSTPIHSEYLWKSQSYLSLVTCWILWYKGGIHASTKPPVREWKNNFTKRLYGLLNIAMYDDSKRSLLSQTTDNLQNNPLCNSTWFVILEVQMFKRECHLQMLVAPCLSNQQLKTPGRLQTREKKNKPWVNELGKNTSDELVGICMMFTLIVQPTL